MKPRYFAYGSNLDDAEIRAARPSYLGPARLDDHRLAFTRRSVRTGTGVADVVPAPGESVWGALYELDEGGVEILDCKEGAGWAYVRRPQEVTTIEGQKVDAFTYTVLRRSPPKFSRPRPISGV